MSQSDYSLDDLAKELSRHPAVLEKATITSAYKPADAVSGEVELGDDCAAIHDPATGGYLLFAAEGMISSFVEEDPWFAGYSAVMVNLSDVAAMGGSPLAITDVLWCSESDHETVELIWDGMRAASEAYGVPIVGGHTTQTLEPSDRVQLAAAVLGRAGENLLTSFHAKPGDQVVMVVDTAGAYRGDKPFWNASTTSTPEKLRQNLGLLPKLAESGLCTSGKDISNGGIVGTLAMLAECSNVGAILSLDDMFRPEGTDWLKWLISFPSFGYLLALKKENVEAAREIFAAEESILVQEVGRFTEQKMLCIEHDKQIRELTFPKCD
ncbi:MAG: sll0787 family AIR synthase-like protein [Verrucomicrobiota bacterium]